MPAGTNEAAQQERAQQPPVLINDVTIEVATPNGTGSQSANNVLVRALFQMGIPVGAKNFFPSNIAGMPTWYTIRANKQGFTARRDDADLVVLMNPDSIKADVAKARPGAIMIVRDDLAAQIERTDVEILAIPFSQMVNELCDTPKKRKYLINMLYIGVLAYLLQIEVEEINIGIDKVFPGKPKVAEMNRKAADTAYLWASENLKPLERYRIERMGDSTGKILIDGNTVCALGAIWGGVTVVGWYPITPSTSVLEMLVEMLPEFRTDPQTGKATYAVVQAEDELAAIGIVLGGGWAGARSFTTTSGPGMSLMAEQAGLSYFAEIPGVIVSVQRMGPSTGLPTHTCQGDILKAYTLSHGDCKHLLLLPGNLKECFEFTCQSFDYAERFQTLTFVMIDLDMGMNLWEGDEFEQPSKPMDRGKVLSAEDLDRVEEFARYRDVDGDGIPYRTLPGTPHPKAAYFTRGTGHTDKATYSEVPAIWTGNLDRLTRKFETARQELPAPVINETPGAEIGILAYGSSDPAANEARHIMATTHEAPTSYLRLRALPAHADAYAFIERHRRVYVVDQNRDAQMASILRAERPDLAAKILSVRHYDGTTLNAQTIVDQILAQEAGQQEGME